ncbi:MAG: HEAT repeat domain-containing protein [Gemmataceae bacterium]|nr:HEAT repeat domain-containing protein [Gemmataceae bacterium]
MLRSLTALCLTLCFIGLLGCSSSTPSQRAIVEGENPTEPGKLPPGRGKPVSEWIVAMRDPSTLVNSDATTELVRIGQPAVSALVEVLKDPDEIIRRRAQTTLGRIGAPAVPEVINGLADASTAPAAMVVLADMRDTALPGMTKALTHEDPKVRAQVCLVMRDIADRDNNPQGEKDERSSVRESAPAVAKLLKDKDPAVRGAAAAALSQIGGEVGIIPDLTEALKDANNPADVRAAAARALRRMGPDARDAAPVLIEGLKDGDEKVRAASAGALGKVAYGREETMPKGTVGGLRQALADGKAPVRGEAAKSLGELGVQPKTVVPELITALKKEKDPRAQAQMATALGRFGDDAESAIPTLAGLLKDKEPGTAEAAALALEKLGEPGQVELAKAVNSPTEKVRKAAMNAVAKVGRGPVATAAVPGLAELLKDKDDKKRVEAATILAQLGASAKGAVPALGEALSDPDPTVRTKSAEALGKIGKSAVPVLAKALKSESDDARSLAAHGLAEAGPEAASAVPELGALLKDKKASVKARENAAYALAQVGPAAKGAMDDLIAALQEKEGDIRRHSSTALGNIGEPAAKPLMGTLEDKNPNVAFAAREAIKRIGKAAVPELTDMVKNGKTNHGRERAIIMLGDMGTDAKSAAAAIEAATKDPDAGVAKAAKAALKKIK